MWILGVGRLIGLGELVLLLCFPCFWWVILLRWFWLCIRSVSSLGFVGMNRSIREDGWISLSCRQSLCWIYEFVRG